jgi:hypothetical protein
MILTKEFVEKLGCPDAEPWIEAHNFWGKTTDELLDALEIDNPSFFEQAQSLISNLIALEILSKNDYAALDTFKVENKEYTSLNDVINMVNQRKLELLNSGAYLFYTNAIEVQDNGDETWLVVDLDTCVQEGLFAIFNPTTGIYTKANGLDNAKTTLAEIKQSIIDGFSVQMYQKITDIYATSSDYNKDAPTTKDFYAKVKKINY